MKVLYALLLSSSLLLTQTHAARFSLTDLGFLSGGTSSQALSISDNGTYITGDSTVTSGDTHAYSYSGGTMTDIGTLGGNFSRGWGINNSGNIAGESINGSGDTRAFYWDGSTMTDLGTLGGASSYGSDINNSNHITGRSIDGSGNTYAFYWDGSTMSSIGALPTAAYSTGIRINNSNQIAGYGSITGNFGDRAFFWDGSTLIDTGTLAGWDSSFSQGLGLNDAGTMVGWARLSTGEYNAFSWTSGGGLVDIGRLPGSFYAYGLDVNSQNQIVGGGDDSTTAWHALMWDNGTINDLNDLVDASGTGWVLREAYSINDAGYIVGWGVFGGDVHAFLLTPLPEPSTWAMMTAGALLLCVATRRRIQKM